jgi:hypothetical protein
MRSTRFIALFAAPVIALALQAGAARAETTPPRLDISILSMGSWRNGDFLRVRVTAPVAEAAQIQGRPVALLINGRAVGSQPLVAHADGALYADFAAPWQGHAQTILAAELVDAPMDVATADSDATLIVQPD